MRGDGPGGVLGPTAWYDLDAGPLVRSFAITGGRGRGGTEFDLLAHVVVTEAAVSVRTSLGPEHRSIVDMLARPSSVAEIAGTLNLPVGVVRVLVADLLAAGAVALYEPSPLSYLPTDHVLAAVIDGLRGL